MACWLCMFGVHEFLFRILAGRFGLSLSRSMERVSSSKVLLARRLGTMHRWRCRVGYNVYTLESASVCKLDGAHDESYVDILATMTWRGEALDILTLLLAVMTWDVPFGDVMVGKKDLENAAGFHRSEFISREIVISSKADSCLRLRKRRALSSPRRIAGSEATAKGTPPLSIRRPPLRTCP